MILYNILLFNLFPRIFPHYHSSYYPSYPLARAVNGRTTKAGNK